METVLYADVLFFVNFSMDFISVWASSYLCSKERRALRMSLAAALGGVYGVFAVAVGLSGVFAYVSAWAVSVLMSLCAFGMPVGFADILRQSALIWGSGALLGGLMTAFLSLFGGGGVSGGGTGGTNGYAAGGAGTAAGGSPTFTFTAAAAAAALYITVRVIARTKARKNITATVFLGEKKAVFTALCDSGNLLRDPISGTPVMTVCEKALFPLIGEPSAAALSRCRPEELKDLPLKIRIIPRKTDTGAGISAAFLPDKVEISENGKRKKTSLRCLVAPLPLPENYFGGHNASFPTDAL